MMDHQRQPIVSLYAFDRTGRFQLRGAAKSAVDVLAGDVDGAWLTVAGTGAKRQQDEDGWQAGMTHPPVIGGARP